MVGPRPGSPRAAAVCLLALALGFLGSASPRGASPHIVISQVYGGGGNTGAPYTHDYIELFNRSSAPVSIAGWSLQYASATGTGNFGANSTQITELPNVTIEPGQYFLVQQASGASGTALPTPDFIDGTPINMSGSAGKVALVSTSVSLGCNGGSTPCPASALANVIDLVGYGSANFFEGSAAAPALTNTTSAARADFGCTDTDDNAADFTSGAPAPRNSASPLHVCDGPPPQPSLSINDVVVTEGDTGTTLATFTVSLNAPAGAAGVTFDIATADDTATTADADYTAASLTAQTIPAGGLTYTFDVAISGDTTVEANERFFVNVVNLTGATLADGQGIGTITNDDAAPPVFDVVVSQVYGGGGNSGATYTHDFVELFNSGTTPVDLTGWSVQYTSATGTGTWQVTPLAGTIQPGRYFLVRQAAGSGGTTALPTPDATGSIAMGAASGKIGLFSTTSAFAGACPAGASLVDLVGFGITSCYEGTAPVAQLSNSTAGLRKRGGCVDTNDNGGDFLVGSPAPRNSVSPPRSCEFQTAPIHAIQGDGGVSPFAGQDVITTGIVTGLKTNGFFVQTPDDGVDGNPQTSEGLFVFTSSPPAVATGDLVSVRGTASEFFTLTQIESTLAGDVTVTSSGHTLPASVVLTPAILDPAGPPTALERFEGMRLHADSLVTVAPTDNFGEVSTVLNGVARPMREPGIERGLPIPPAAEGGTDCCIPIWDRNPERILLDSDGLAGAPRRYFTSNVTLTGVAGPLDFSFGRYKILPEAPLVASENMTAAAAPAPAPNEFTVAGYNIENYNGGETQRRKAALHIRNVMRSPDVIGVVEIATLSALQALAAQVNGDAVSAGEPDPGYQAWLIPFGTGSQHVGFLVKATRVLVHAVTQERAGDTYLNPVTGQPETLHDRPPLVLDATVDPAGVNPGRIIVVVNHLRSFIDIELVDGEGVRVRAKRTAQAEAIAELLQQLQTDNPGIPVISVGDYNAYQFSDGYTDPVAILKGQPTPGDQIVVGGSPDLVNPDFANLTDSLPPDQRYSFIFEGTPQALDHVLVNAVAHAYLQRYAVARSNADFPGAVDAGYSGNTTRPEAQSDHDSPVAYFAFPGTPVVTLNGGATMTVEAFTSFVDPGATAHDDNGSLPVTVTGSVDVNVPGTYTLRYTAGNLYATTTVTRTVIVADTIAPVITGVGVTPSTYGPPNHEMFDVAVFYSATDASGTVACGLGVTSNEPANGLGDGNTVQDWVVVNARQVQLRAERSGTGSGRVYTIAISCTDPSGNSSARTASVTIGK